MRRILFPALLILPILSCGAKPPEKTPADQLAAQHHVAAPASTAPTEVQGLPTLTSLVESVKGSVINVEVTSRTKLPQFGGPGDEFWERFFGGPFGPRQMPREQLRQGMGSGFIVSPDGVALTNNHVVDGAVSIRVKLEDGRQYDAEILGQDALTDLAVIKLKGKVENLPVGKLGDSDALKVGEWVVAIGNPFGLASSVSAGIISAKARVIGAGPYDDFLQTDAAINPGNSGGPLFNLRGEVVGINTAIVGGGSGIGFAVPANMAKALLPQLQNDGAVTRGWLGVAVQDLTAELAKALQVPTGEGALVGEVNRGGPADQAGLRAEDVVVAVDGEPIKSSAALTRKIALRRPGSAVALTIYRDGEQREMKVKLGTRPDLEGVGGGGRRASDDDDSSEKLGLRVRDVPAQVAQARGLPQGAFIDAVEPGSAADRAGLLPGMIVTEVNRKAISSARQFVDAVRGAKSGSTLLLRAQANDSKVLRALTVP